MGTQTRISAGFQLATAAASRSPSKSTVPSLPRFVPVTRRRVPGGTLLGEAIPGWSTA